MYHNIVKGAYRSVDHYLEVQYRLLREDFVGPLRSGIQEYVDSLAYIGQKKKKHTTNKLRIYPKVKFLKFTIVDNRFGFLVNYDVLKKFRKVNWEISKQFVFGSLLLFTTDDFKSFFIGKVLERNVSVLKEGNVCVEIAPGSVLPENLMSVEFVMAESEIYFEPYYNVLIALQSITVDNFPMKRYIIDAEKDILIPQYISANINKKDSMLYRIDDKEVNILNDAEWPCASDFHLNDSQYAAFKSALTSEFVIIQGPPGTGKTFLGLKIVKALLKNLNVDMFPLLVICYTNHALDQFLEGILQFTKNVIRIGGRSQNTELSEYNLKCRRARFKNIPIQKGVTYKIQKEMQHILEDITSLDYLLHKNYSDCILSIESFESIMNKKQYELLQFSFLQWLTDRELFLASDNREHCDDNACVEENVATKYIQHVTSDKKLDEDKIYLQKTIDEKDIVSNTEKSQENDEDEVSKLRRDERCEDFELEINFNLTSLNIQEPNICLNLENVRNQIKGITDYLKLIRNIENNDLHLLREYVQLEIRLEEAKILYNYVCIQLNKKIDFDYVQQKQLYNIDDIFSLNLNERWALYHWWLKRLFDSYSSKIKKLEQRYRELHLKLVEVKQLQDVRLLQDAKVIGITTSGAASRRTMIENLNARVGK